MLSVSDIQLAYRLPKFSNLGMAAAVLNPIGSVLSVSSARDLRNG